MKGTLLSVALFLALGGCPVQEAADESDRLVAETAKRCWYLDETGREAIRVSFETNKVAGWTRLELGEWIISEVCYGDSAEVRPEDCALCCNALLDEVYGPLDD